MIARTDLRKIMRIVEQAGRTLFECINRDLYDPYQF